jgi:ABC-type multidrug transport system fused ATPase/permease subunit
VVPLALALLAAAAAGALVKVLERARAERLGSLYAGAVRARLLEQLLGRAERGGPRRLGGLLARLSGELAALRGWPGRGLPRLLSDGTLTLACLAAAFLVDARLGALLAALLVTTLLLALALRPGLLAMVEDLRRRRGRVGGLVGRSLAVHLAGERPPSDTLRAVSDAEARIARLAARRGGRAATLLALPDLLRGLLVAALVLLAAGLGPGEPISAGVVAAGLALLAALVPALRELARVLDRHAAWKVARRRLAELLARSGPANQPTAADQERQPAA